MIRCQSFSALPACELSVEKWAKSSPSEHMWLCGVFGKERYEKTRTHAHTHCKREKEVQDGQDVQPFKDTAQASWQRAGFQFFLNTWLVPSKCKRKPRPSVFLRALMGGQCVTHHFDITSTDRWKTTMTDLFKEPSWCEKRHNPGYIWPVWKDASLPSGAWYKPSHNMSLTTNADAL